MHEIILDGEIGFDIMAKKVAEDLKLFGRKEATILLNSAGGSVTEGIGVFNAISRHPGKVRIEITGVALSMAGVILAAGHHVIAPENALVMIHRPWTGGAGGTATDLRRTAATMDKMEAALVAALVKKTGKTEAEISAALDEELWMTAAEAKDFGLVDEVIEPMELAASFDLSPFKNVPPYIASRIKAMTTKTADPTKTQNPDPTVILAAERQRREDIRATFSGYVEDHRALLDRCLDDSAIDAKDAGQLLLKALGTGAGPIGDYRSGSHITTGGDDLTEFRAAATDALLAREGIKVKKPHPSARDLERMSAVAMAEVCLKRAGLSTRGMSVSQIVNRAFTHSTSDFPLLLEDAANKAVRAGMENTSASFREWVDITEIPDFKSVSRVGLGAAPDLLPVREGGEIEQGTFGEEAEKYSLESYARIFSITRKAIINDDLSALTTLPNAFAASAVRKEGDLVYSILTTNGNMSDGNPLFHATHSNIGTAATPSVAALAEARKLMRRQKTVGGTGLLNAIPSYVIAPAALETEFEVLLASLVDPARSNDTGNSAFVRGLTLVVDPRLDETSETAWYLAADARTVGTIELGRLAGEPVSIETQNGFEIDGVSIKCRLDAGAAAVDWRGMVYNAGA